MDAAIMVQLDRPSSRLTALIVALKERLRRRYLHRPNVHLIQRGDWPGRAAVRAYCYLSDTC